MCSRTRIVSGTRATCSMAPRRSLAAMAGRGVPEDGRAARCLRRESQQDAHRGGLAGAIGAQHRQQFAALDGEIDSAQRGHRSVILGDVL